MRKDIVIKTIFITITFASCFLAAHQVISSTNDQLTDEEIALFLNDVHHSLDLVAQKSELTLDQRYTYFSSSKSVHVIGFAKGVALGSTAVSQSILAAIREDNLNNVAMAGATVVGAIVLPTVIGSTGLAVITLTAVGTTIYNALRYITIASTFATIVGLTSSPSGRNNTLLPNIDGATYVDSHYRMNMYYVLDTSDAFDHVSHVNKCLLSFAIEVWSPGYAINYDIHDCDHNEIFHQNQPSWGFRTGDHVGIIDKAMGYDKVVTSGQVKIRQN